MYLVSILLIVVLTRMPLQQGAISEVQPTSAERYINVLIFECRGWRASYSRKALPTFIVRDQTMRRKTGIYGNMQRYAFYMTLCMGMRVAHAILLYIVY